MVLALALGVTGVVARPVPASPVPTLRGFSALEPVFEENGFRPFRATYVRCYRDDQWRRLVKARSRGPGLMGWYDGGVWIHVRGETCTNALKLLNEGQLTHTNVVAVATLLHETIHRQGIRDEADTECLTQWMVGHVVKRRTGSLGQAIRALTIARSWDRAHLPVAYLLTDADCGRLAAGWGIGPLAEGPDGQGS